MYLQIRFPCCAMDWFSNVLWHHGIGQVAHPVPWKSSELQLAKNYKDTGARYNEAEKQIHVNTS